MVEGEGGLSMRVRLGRGAAVEGAGHQQTVDVDDLLVTGDSAVLGDALLLTRAFHLSHPF